MLRNWNVVLFQAVKEWLSKMGDLSLLEKVVCSTNQNNAAICTVADVLILHNHILLHYSHL